MDRNKANKLIHASLGSKAMDNQIGREGTMVPTALLLKAAEEAGEFIQSVMKCLNPQSSSHCNFEKVAEEAGHTAFFLDVLNAFLSGKVTEEKHKRIKRHMDNPKSGNTIKNKQ